MRGFDRIESGFLIERPLLESILIFALFWPLCSKQTSFKSL